MFVTSLTTAAAFFANISSDIVGVKCFGLFSGTAIIVNYLLMVTLLPCCVIIQEKYISKSRTIPVMPALDRIKDKLHGAYSNFFQRFLPLMITKARYLLVILFFGLGVAGVVVAFAEPGLNPPLADFIQMFDSDMSIEKYDMVVKNSFDAGVQSGVDVSIEFVFGVELTDNGDKFNPDNRGSMVLKSGELGLASNQVWLLQFCRNVRASSFYDSSQMCDAIELFYRNVTSKCDGGLQCCGKVIPLEESQFMNCLSEFNVFTSGGIYQPLLENNILKTLVVKVSCRKILIIRYPAV